MISETTGAAPRPASNQIRKYLFFSSWPVKAGTGVNNVMLGLSSTMLPEYDPLIVVTGWNEPPADQRWIRMPTPAMPARNLLGFLIHFIPNIVRLRGMMRNGVAVNPHFFGPEILPLVVLRKLRLAPKLILSVHGADVSHALGSTGIERQLYSWMYKAADAVVACSHALGENVRQISPRANVKVVWNGISEPPDTFGERPLASPYLVSVAAFVRKKGHDVLLKAFAEVATRFPALNLVLIGGDGPERVRVTEQIVQSGLESRVKVIVDLPHEQVWTWVKHAECFVIASREEPFGIAILEAALVRTPVVATSVGGIPEFLTNGVHGLTIRPDEPAALAEALTHALTDIQATAQRVSEFHKHALNFTWKAAWEKYQRILGILPSNGEQEG